MSIKGGLDAATLADAPKVAPWNFVAYSRAMRCAEADGGVNILTGRGQLVELSMKSVPAVDGDKYQFSGEFSGKGHVSIGLHLYDKRRVWQGTVWGQIKIDGKNGKFGGNGVVPFRGIIIRGHSYFSRIGQNVMLQSSGIGQFLFGIGQFPIYYHFFFP